MRAGFYIDIYGDIAILYPNGSTEHWSDFRRNWYKCCAKLECKNELDVWIAEL